MTRTKSNCVLRALSAVLFLLICHEAGHAQALQSPPSFPILVVTLDVGRVKAAGVPDDAVTRQAIRDCMTASGASLVLMQEAIRASSENEDITNQVIARAKGATGDCPAAKAFALRLEVLDVAAAKKFGATEDETAINAAATKWMRDSKANVVVDKQAVVIASTSAIDVTGNVIASVTRQPAQTRVQPFQGQIRLLDRKALLQYSKAGQDISRQTQVYIVTTKQELGQRADELAKKGKALQDALPTLSRDEKALRFTTFKEEEAALQESIRLKGEQIRDAVERARHVMEQAFQPVLSKMMKDHGFDLVLDTGAVSSARPELDATGEAIEKLDAVLSSVPVTLTDK